MVRAMATSASISLQVHASGFQHTSIAFGRLVVGSKSNLSDTTALLPQLLRDSQPEALFISAGPEPR